MLHLQLKDEMHYRPIDLARRAGISPASIRSYEQLGFLPAADRRPSGHRRYTDRHARALDASRALIAGYGWMPALEIMQAVHREELSVALALIDELHTKRDRTRRELRAVADGLRHLLDVADLSAEQGVSPAALRIGEVAGIVGVRRSAIRFWEGEGLVTARRDRESGYRIYGAHELRDIRIVAMLREASYGFPAIRGILDEVRDLRPERALAAIADRERALEESGRACLKANALLWTYLEMGDLT
jgi:DNA-binding transcriptional MerR regulator